MTKKHKRPIKRSIIALCNEALNLPFDQALIVLRFVMRHHPALITLPSVIEWMATNKTMLLAISKQMEEEAKKPVTGFATPRTWQRIPPDSPWAFGAPGRGKTAVIKKAIKATRRGKEGR